MKPRILSTVRLSFSLATAIAGLLATPAAHAATYYWDNNGTTAGFGTVGGTWTVPTVNQWSTDATGVAAPGASITTLNTNNTTDALNFGTATVGLAAGTITVSGTVAAGDITFGSASGAILLSGGTINLTAASTITVNNTTDTISSNITGAATSLTKAGTGILVLSGTGNTFAGTIRSSGTTTNGGTLSYASAGGANPIVVTQTTNLFTLQYTGGGLTMSGAITASALTTGTFTLDASGTGAINYSNTASLGSAASGIKILTLSGTNTGANTLAGLWANNTGANANVIKNGAGTWTLSANNTYTGSTTVNEGSLTLSGTRTAALGGVNVGSDGKNAVLNITNASFNPTATGTFAVGASNTAGFTGTVNQSGGTVTISGGSNLLIGNGGTGLSGAQRVNGVYNLSGGTLTSSATTAIRLGVNAFTSGTLNVSGGTLTLTGGTTAATSPLQIGRADSASSNSTAAYNQTGGTATVSRMTIGGAAAAANVTAGFSVTGGSFTATAFDLLAASSTGVSTMTIGGTGLVTLPNFPTTRGSGSTATLIFDGGTLRNSATGTFITGLTNAFIQDGGAQFDTALNSTTISQNLLTDPVSLGGGLTKIGINTLTLTGTATYTGATAVNAGTLTLSGTGAINASSGITLTGSSKLLQTSSVAVSPTVTQTLGTVTGSGTINTVNVANAAGNIISNNNGVAGASLTIGALTFGGAATVNTFSNSTSAPIVTTNLASNLLGTVTINPTAASWISGSTYNLISYTGGSIGGAGFGQFALGPVTGFSARQSASSLMDSGTAITFTVNGTSIYWVGNGDGKWNAASTLNWKQTSDNADTTFLTGDDVVFNDGASPATPVNVDINTANVAPATTVFNNTTKDYTVSGAFGISGGTLTKNGTGTVTIGTVNTYTGATTINAGAIVLSGSGTLGTGSALTLGGGSLDLGGGSKTVGAVSVTAPAASGNTIGNGSLTGTSYAASNASGNALISANLLVNGAAGFTKTGAGAVTLSGANTFTGATNVRDGSVVLAGGANRLLSTGSVVIGDTGTTGKLVLGDASATSDQTLASLTTTGLGGSVVGGNASNSVLTLNTGTVTYAGSLGGAGTNENNLALSKTGTGTLTLSGASTYSGGTSITGGSVSVTTNNTALGSGTVAFSGSGTAGVRLVVATGLNVANAITLGYATGAAGRGLIEAGTTTGTATVSGAINITATPTSGGHFAAPTANTILNVTGPITSSVPVTSRIGIVVFSGGGTGYTAFGVGQGTARVGANDGLATTATVAIGTSGIASLDLNGFNQSLVGVTGTTATIGNSSTTADSTLTLTGTSSFAGTIVDVISPGTKKVNLTINGGTTTLSGTNTYTGATTLSAGTLSVGLTANLGGAASNLVFDGGILQVTGTTLNNFSGIGHAVTFNAGKTVGLDINNAANTFTVDQVLNQTSGGFTKLGAGTVILDQANTYTGATTVSAGKLIIDGSTAAGSAVSVDTSGTLGGTGTIAGTLALTGILAPGTGSGDIQTLDAGTTTWNGGSIWNFDLSSVNNTSDNLNITGNLIKGTAGDFGFNFMGSTPVWNTTYTLTNFTALTGFLQADFDASTAASILSLGAGSYSTSYFTLNGTSLTFTAVPEPTSALVGLLIGAGLLRRRRSA